MWSAPSPRTLVALGYPWETEPRLTVCFVFLVRSHLREVSRLSAQGRHPYPLHYQVAFASSRIPYRLRHPPRLRSGDSRALHLAPPQRANPAYHVPRFVPPKGRRTPRYTGGYLTCVGRPLKPTAPDPRPTLGLEPVSHLSSAGLRCVTPRLHFRYPYPSFPAVGPLCGSAFRRLLCA